MNKIACTHPGRLGDAIYALPAIKKVCQMREALADFYTSKYCRPLERLFGYQSYIHGFYMPDNYQIERMDMGVQPWRVPVDIGLYDMTYHMGFRTVPDKAIPDFIMESTGLSTPARIEYEYPEFETSKLPYIVVAPRGETSFKKLFNDFIEICPMPCYVAGSNNDYTGIGIDITGLDLLETTTWIAKSKGFVGLMSSQLAIANGFDIPKIAPHDGIHWDMRHVIYSDTNFYPVNPTANDLIKILGL